MKSVDMRYFILIYVSLMAFNASAQMIELLGNIGVQGAMTQQGTQAVSAGISALKNTQLLSAIQQTAMEIKASHLYGYQNVNKNSIINDGRFQNVQWNVGPVEKNQFYIELYGLNEGNCRYLMRSVHSARSIDVNGQGREEKACSSKSKIKFTFN